MPPKAPLNLGLLPPSFLLPSSVRSVRPQVSPNAAPSIHAPAVQTSYTTVRTVMRFKKTDTPKPNRFDYDIKRGHLEAGISAALERRAHSTPLRTGLLATKRGMTALYDAETGKRSAATVLQIDRNEILAVKTREKNGYWAVQIGAGARDANNVTRPMLGHFASAGVAPKRHVGEFKVAGKEGVEGLHIGRSVGASWFTPGQWVDVRGMSRGMGFAGGMKRHNFGGQPASHGQSLMHRGMGSAGGSQGSGSRVLPGKRMPGRMGNERVTVKNLRVLQVDEANGIVVVSGPVPGPKNQLIKVQDAIGKPWPKGPMTLADMYPPTVAASTESAASATATA